MTDREPPPAEAEDPPWSREAEQSLLGCLLLDNTCMGDISDLVAAESFYHHAHKGVFAVVAELLASSRQADVVTVFERLRELQLHEEAPREYLDALTQCVPNSRHARRYAEAVADRAAERALLTGLDDMMRVSRQQAVPLAERLERIFGLVRQVESRRNAPGAKRVPLLGLQALAKASRGVRWLVKHVLPADAVGMLFGGSGTFKSFIALDAALHVAHGLPWMGRRTDKGPVLYIAAEGGSGLWARIEAWHRSRNMAWQGAPLYVVPAALDLTQDAWRVVEAAQMQGVAPVMVVVDTLSQTYAGEENSANEMAAYLRTLGERFRALWQCTVLLIHHSGHMATERPRGSSAIRANIDFLLGVSRDERELMATLGCQKQKDGELFDDAVFKLSVCELGVDEDNDKVTSLVARHLGTQDDVQEALAEEAAAGRAGRQHAFMSLVQNGMPEKDLRKLFYDLLVDLDAEAKRKAYGRARKQAELRGDIEVAQGFVIDLRGMRKGRDASR